MSDFATKIISNIILPLLFSLINKKGNEEVEKLKSDLETIKSVNNYLKELNKAKDIIITGKDKEIRDNRETIERLIRRRTKGDNEDTDDNWDGTI